MVAALLGWGAAAESAGLAPLLDAQAPGLRLAEAGVGLSDLEVTGSESLMIFVGGPVERALLYWAGGGSAGQDDALLVNGVRVDAEQTAVDSDSQPAFDVVGYRADVTALVDTFCAPPGVCSFTVQDADLANNFSSNLVGVGLLVVYKDESDPGLQRLVVFDGMDWVFSRPPFSAPTTDAVTFSYAAEAADRVARFVVFGVDAEPTRADLITISDNPPLVNQLVAGDGNFYDTLAVDILVPGGVGTTAALLISPPEPPLADSVAWQVVGLQLPVTEGCQLQVDKLCSVRPAPRGDLACTSKVAATRLRYIGPDRSNVTVTFEGKDGGSATYANVNLVSGVTVLAGANGQSVDARPGTLGSKTTLRIGGAAEVIHTSCSTPYVAGAPAPLDSPKGDPSSLWQVESFVDKNGTVVALSANDPDELGSECTAVLSSGSKAKKTKKLKKAKKAKKSKKSKGVDCAGAEVEYVYAIRHSGASQVKVDVEDDVLGLLASRLRVPAGREVVLRETQCVTATTRNTVRVVASKGPQVCGGAEASALVTVEAPPASCADGKPRQLVFEYTGKSCAEGVNGQRKDSCSGDPRDADDVAIVVTKDASAVALDRAAGLDVGDRVTVTATGGKFKSELALAIRGASGLLQSVAIHTSCSDVLDVGDEFGSLRLVGFVPQ